MKTKRILSASLEDYLETILNIEADKKAARVKDIADRMQVRSASVTGALRTLAERELVNYAPYDIVTLTPTGEAVARKIARRHRALNNFFCDVLCVEEQVAEDCACRMEHMISDSVMERFVSLAELLATGPCGAVTWDPKTHSFVFRKGRES